MERISAEKILYLVRHGQTLFNLQGKIQGWCDSPLTELGKEQAQTAREYFQKKQIRFDKCFCSTSERTVDTLEIITGQPYCRLKGLKEWNFGRLEGERELVNPPLPFRDFFVKYGGEDQEEFQKRTVQVCNEIISEAGQSFLVVTHGAFCARFRTAWDDYSSAVYKLGEGRQDIGNCCIFKYGYAEGVFRLMEIIPSEKQKQ